MTRARITLAVTLAALLVIGFIVVQQTGASVRKTRVTAFFENSNGLYPGDKVRVLGVPVGEIESIEPQPLNAKVTFWIDDQYKIPAGATAAVLAPTLVTARFIQLTPAYTTGPVMQDGAVIARQHTAVPVEFDDLRAQLQKLNDTLQPTEPGGVSTLGAFVNTTANNLRGQGQNIRDTVVRLSQAMSIIGDQSGNIFGTVKNLSVLVTALRDVTDVMGQLNQNLAGVTGLLADDPNEVGAALRDLSTTVDDVRGFIGENRERLGTSFDKLAEITQALSDSSDEVKQALHSFPTAASNFINIYEPAQAAVSGVLSGNNFSNPISFICGAIQAASRMNAEQSAKLCVQYLAPIIKNRQYNFLGPLGFNGSPFFPLLPVGTNARPNEITFSEEWMRPDYVPPAAQAPAEPAGPLPAEAPLPGGPGSSTDPTAGLTGMMVPAGGGS